MIEHFCNAIFLSTLFDSSNKSNPSKQYKLDFSGLSGRSTSNARDEEGNSGMQGSDSKGTANSEASMWQYGMRRGKGDARRTRVSFLLF